MAIARFKALSELGRPSTVELDENVAGSVQPEELEADAIQSKRTIEIDKFVPRNEIDEIFFNSH